MGSKIKGRNAAPIWYGNLTLLLHKALILRHCCFFAHISWTKRFKCHSNSLQVQKQAVRIHSAALTQNGNLNCIQLHKRSLSSRRFTHHLLCFWANILILVVCESLHAAYLCTLDTSGGDLSSLTLPSCSGQRQVSKPRWDTLPPRVGFLSLVTVKWEHLITYCCLSTEQSLLIMNYHKGLLGSPQTCLISTVLAVQWPFWVCPSFLVFVMFFSTIIFLDPFLRPMIRPPSSPMGFDFIV